MGVALLGSFGVFFPSAVFSACSLLLGVLSWLVGMLFHTWINFLRFFLAILIATTCLAGICATRAWLEVRWITGDGPWNLGSNHSALLIKDTISVVSAILIELVLPIFLILVLILLLFSLTTILLPASLDEIQRAISDISDIFSNGLRLTTSNVDALVSSISAHVESIMSTLKDTFAKSAAIVGGAVSAGASLIIYIFKRRHSNISTAHILSNEIRAIIKSTVETTPKALAYKDVLIQMPTGQQVIVAGPDRELLLLGSATVAKLPACLLTTVVRFFHADLALSQVYSSVGSEAFAQAAAARREGYLNAYENIWLNEYQPAAFSVLFRLSLYTRLRAWTI
jgi:hypothetical protein